EYTSEPPKEIRYAATGFMAVSRRVIDALVLDQSEQTGAGGNHLTTQVGVAEAFQLPQNGLTISIQRDLEARLLVASERDAPGHQAGRAASVTTDQQSRRTWRKPTEYRTP